MFASIISSAVGFVTAKIAGWGFLKIVKSPLFWAGGGIVGMFLVYHAGVFVGHSRAAAKCNAAAVQAQLDAAKADLEIARKVAEQVVKEMEILDAQADDLEEKVAKYEDELSKRPDKCPLTKSDVKRLRNIK
jgi:hypothetical protein